MSSTASEAEEAITEEEMTSTAVPASTSKPPAKPRNAFAELMAPKPTAPSKPPSTMQKVFKNRDGLGAYLAAPASFPPERVIYHTPAFVAIHDLYPKAAVHALLLPRAPDRQHQHPLDALSDAQFLAAVRAEAAKLKRLLASELQRRFGAVSRSEAARMAVLRGEVEVAGEEDLPQGRDWEAELRVGIHSRPSMSHLHVHVLSRDMHSECLRHLKHYNSFNTPFFVDLDAFPLAEDDPQRHPGREGYIRQELKCWRCGKCFKNRFAQLKRHLDDEFEEWSEE